MTILITGAKGQLGSELRDLLGPRTTGIAISSSSRSRSEIGNLRGDDKAIFVDRDELDITDESAVKKFFTEHKPDYCINAAAYTNVEKAEDEKKVAYAVNVTGVQNIARACAKNNTLLLHISTDFVFDGKKSVPYTEEDEPHPLGVYGQTKYEGELAVQELCPKSFIVRPQWLYSSYGSNFVKTILRLCRTCDSLPVVADQYGSPTYARDLAQALVQMVGAREEKRLDPHFRGDDLPFGMYHYANDGEVTWFEFAQKIVELAGLSCVLQPIPASDFPSKVTRPAYSVLSTKKIQRIFGIVPPDWEESIESCLSLIK